MSYYEGFVTFLPLAFCGYASYTDLKTEKILNFCSLGLLYIATLSQLMAWYLGTTTVLYILGLFLGSGLIAFALYWFGIFSPGDAKLFWGLCLIFPASLFRDLSGTLSFPPLILGVNIIIPYALGILGYLLFKFVFMENKLDLLRSLFAANTQKTVWVERLFSLLLFIGIGSALTYVLRYFGWYLDRLLRLVFVWVAFRLIQKLLSPLEKTAVYYAMIAVVSVFLTVQVTPSVSAFFSGFAFFLGVYFVLFIFAKDGVLTLASVTLDNTVDIGCLEIGMLLAEEIVEIPQTDGSRRYEKRYVEFSSRHGSNTVIAPDPAGLTAAEIAHLQQLAAEGAFAEFGDQIKIQPSIRFAPIISVGVLLTILCEGPFYLKLIKLF